MTIWTVTARIIQAAAIALLSVSPSSAEPDAWPGIRKDLFGERAVEAATFSTLQLYAPSQAADGALVPVSVHMSTAIAMKAKALTIVIDRNPAPVAATVHFGEAWRRGAEIGDRIVSTRLRVDSFSKMRAILETDDGRLLMSEKFVAGAGGCSALPSKDPDQVLAELGRVKVTATAHSGREGNWREGVVMIRHPNFTGMQLDPKSGAYTPARYVRQIEVTDGEQTIFDIEGGISLSEDPNFRFTYVGSTRRLELRAIDSEGLQIAGSSADAPS